MNFHVQVSRLRMDYIEFANSNAWRQLPWRVYLCLFMEHQYGLSDQIVDNKNLLRYLESGWCQASSSMHQHGVQGYVTQEFAQRMVNTGCEILVWPSEAAYADPYDWTAAARIAFRVGLLTYIIEKHGDVILSFKTDGEEEEQDD
jgi:hypothetical protein